MKAFMCFALLAVASAIPLQDDRIIIIQDAPVPIPVEMLRRAASLPMPVWRDLPLDRLPEDIFAPIPERMMRGFDNSVKISDVQFLNDLPGVSSDIQAVYAGEGSDSQNIVPEPVNVVDLLEPSYAEEIIPEPVKVAESFEPAIEVADVFAPEVAPSNDAEEIIPESVRVADSFEPASESDVLAPEVAASEDAELRFVKFVNSPAQFDMKNLQVPIDARDIV